MATLAVIVWIALGITNVGTSTMEMVANEDGGSADRIQPPRVWTFGIGRDKPPLEKLDMSHGRVVGLGADMVQSACRMAGKHCEFVSYSNYTQCWSADHGFSPGLAYSWFDACVSFMPTFERRLVNAFSRPYTREPISALYTRHSETIQADDLRESGNRISVGFIAGSWLDAECLRRNGFMVNEDKMLAYENTEALMQALWHREVRVIFAERHVIRNMFKMIVTENMELSCAIEGASVMTRKGNYELLEWLNPALERVMGTYEYFTMCYVWEKIFDEPTNCFLGDNRAGDDNRSPNSESMNRGGTGTGDVIGDRDNADRGRTGTGDGMVDADNEERGHAATGNGMGDADDEERGRTATGAGAGNSDDGDRGHPGTGNGMDLKVCVDDNSCENDQQCRNVGGRRQCVGENPALQPIIANPDSDTESISTGGISAITALAVLVGILSTLAILLGTRAWRKRSRNDVSDDDDSNSAVSNSSSRLSSVMFRSGTLRSDWPADTISNPTVNNQCQETSMQ